LPGQNWLEIVVSDGVFVFLANETLFDEHIEIGRAGVGVLHREKSERSRVLQPAENELFFFLASRHLFPDGHDNGHHDRGEAEPDEQGRHCVTIVPCLTVRLHGAKMLRILNIARFRDGLLAPIAAVAILASVSCERVPLLAPSGSTITLTASATALSVNGTAQLIAQVVEPSGTPPHSGTHIIFTTSLGSILPAESDTDINGRVLAIFKAGSDNGTATITASSGGVVVPAANALKISVGTAAVGRVIVSANPALIPATGGTAVISATVSDINGNALAFAPVAYSTTAGVIDPPLATTDSNGVATSNLRTSTTATVTASVGAQGGTGTGGGGTGGGGTTTPTAPAPTGQASGSVTVNVAAAPTLVIAPPSTPPAAGLPAIFTFTVTVPAANGSAIRDLTVNWGDGTPTQDLGVVTSTSTQTHVFRAAGNYVISAVLTDTFGNTVPQSTQITVIPVQRPGIQITQSPNPGHSGVPTTLLIQVTPATGIGVQDLLVDYGDGQSADLGGTSSAQIQHIYTVPAGSSTFTVRVTVLDTSGQTTIGLAVISVTNP
jgi:hypothetical protein